MSNPYFGVRLNDRYFAYDSGSFRFNLGLKNNYTEAEGRRKFSIKGANRKIFSLTLIIQNEFFTVDPSTNNLSSGTTTWLGLSQQSFLNSLLGSAGVSMPISFYSPEGVSYNVVPINSLDYSIFIPTPESTGIEYRLNLSLAEL